MKKVYFQKILKRAKKRKKIIIRKIKRKDPLTGSAIDVIIWTILSERFAIYVIYQKVKMYSIIHAWEIANNIEFVI